ncbi:MAG: hypothetical protein ACOCX4_01770 [Planctomycetota bacterium]
MSDAPVRSVGRIVFLFVCLAGFAAVGLAGEDADNEEVRELRQELDEFAPVRLKRLELPVAGFDLTPETLPRFLRLLAEGRDPEAKDDDAKDEEARDRDGEAPRTADGEGKARVADRHAVRLFYFHVRRPDEAPDWDVDKKAYIGAVRESGEIWDKVFSGERLRIGIGLRYAEGYSVDLARVAPAANPVFHAENAPMVVVTDPEGAIVAVLRGGKLTERGVYEALKEGLKRDGIPLAGLLDEADEQLTTYARALRDAVLAVRSIHETEEKLDGFSKRDRYNRKGEYKALQERLANWKKEERLARETMHTAQREALEIFEKVLEEELDA